MIDSVYSNWTDLCPGCIKVAIFHTLTDVMKLVFVIPSNQYNQYRYSKRCWYVWMAQNK